MVLRLGTITLELTHRCHRHCAFCYVPDLAGQHAQHHDELAASELTRALAPLIRASGCSNLQLSGGEPLLRADLLDVIDGLRGAGARVSIITDGAHLDASLARALADRGVGPIQPTLLSGDPAVHDSLRGKGAFHSATHAIATAAAAGLEVIACMVITRRNHQEAARVAELAFALGARGLALSRFTPAGAAAAAFSTLMPTAGQVRAACESAASACRRLGFALASAVTIPPCVWSDPSHPPLRVGVCSLVGPRSTITIGPDGSVRSCSLSTDSVGNVLAEPWSVLEVRLWDSCLAPLRDNPPAACAGCPHLSRCLGGCRLSALAVFGDLEHADPLAPVSAARLACSKESG